MEVHLTPQPSCPCSTHGVASEQGQGETQSKKTV